MAIYRGDGTPTGGENVYSQADLDAAVAAALASETAAAASETAAEAAQTAAELAETNAETAETNAETAQTAAETAQTAAELAETNAETAETNAETAETGAEAAQTAAEAALDSFDDRYLGAKASDPTLDNDGNALLTGALYFKTAATVGMYVYSGSAWGLVTGMLDLVDDLTPQLGADLDVNGQEIVSVSNGDIVLSPHGTGEAKVGTQVILTESLSGDAGDIIASGTTDLVGDATASTVVTFDMDALGLSARAFQLSLTAVSVSGLPTAANNKAGISESSSHNVGWYVPGSVFAIVATSTLTLIGSGFVTIGEITQTTSGASGKDWNLICTNGTGAHMDADSTVRYSWILKLVANDQDMGA